MRFLIDTYLGPLFSQGKYARVLAKISELEKLSEAGREFDCVFVSALGNLLFESDCRFQKRRVAKKSYPAAEIFQRYFKMMYLCYLSPSRKNLSPDTVREMVWTLAKFGDYFPSSLKKRLGDLAGPHSNIEIETLYNHWLIEDSLRDGRSREWREINEVKRGDVLLLPGASWAHVSPQALSERYSNKGVTIVYFLYDLLPLDNPSIVSIAEFDRFQKFIIEMCATADYIVTPDTEIRDRLRALFPENRCTKTDRIVSTCFRSTALKPREVTPSSRICSLGLHQNPFMLSLASLAPRKNLLWLYEICADLRKQTENLPKLVMTGQVDNQMDQAKALKSHLDWEQNGVFISNPTDDELAWLLSNACLFLDASFDGGLGMSLMDAVNFNIPCVAAAAPSLVKASGGRAIHLPKDREKWLEAIASILFKPIKLHDPMPQQIPELHVKIAEFFLDEHPKQ